jgi:hypothetical protein
MIAQRSNEAFAIVEAATKNCDPRLTGLVVAKED